MMKSRNTYNWLYCIVAIVLSSCSTHFYLEGVALNDQGAFMEAAEQYERATKSKKYKVQAYTALVDIYTELNSHEEALRCLDSLQTSSQGILTNDQLFLKAESQMALGQYNLALETFNEMESSPSVVARINSINSIDERQKKSVLYRVRTVEIENLSDEAPRIASAALPHRVNDDLYFVAESPRIFKQRKKSEVHIDDYTGNRLMDLWKGAIIDTLGYGGAITLEAVPMLEVNTEFHDGVVAHHIGDTIGVLGKTYVRPEETFIEKLKRPAGIRILRPIQLFHTDLITDSLGVKHWVTDDRLEFCDDKYMFAHPSLSPDGQTLYFTSNMPGGIGGMDIWKVDRKEASWGEPENLGGIVNTTRDEAFPTMRHNDTLYFSSNGHLGLGGLDIVYATRGANDEWASVNDQLPSPINSPRDDFGLQLDPTGEGGIFASDRNGIDSLYHFSTYDPEIILNVVTVHKSDFSLWPKVEAELAIVDSLNLEEFVTDTLAHWSTSIKRGLSYTIECPNYLGYIPESFYAPEDQTVRELLVYVPIPFVVKVGCMDEEATNYDSEAIVDDGSCEYYVPEPELEIVEDFNDNSSVVFDDEVPLVEVKEDRGGCTIPHACNYDGYATKDDGSCEYTSCITEVTEIEEEEVKDKTDEVDVIKSVINIPLKVHWDLDKYSIRDEDKGVIKEFAEFLLANSEFNVLLISHCDIRATHSYNDDLSQSRANSIMQALIREGVPASRLVSYGASETFPIISCKTSESCSEEQHQTNRRTVANILGSNESVIIHRVKIGETLWGLSNKYGVSQDEIRNWNGMQGLKIRLGQDVLIYQTR